MTLLGLGGCGWFDWLCDGVSTVSSWGVGWGWGWGIGWGGGWGLIAIFGSTPYYLCEVYLAVYALVAYKTDSLMAHSEHWASHAYVGCELHRSGCDYWTSYILAWTLEAVYPTIIGKIDLDKKDVSATMWGWKEYLIEDTCLDVALYLFPSQYDEDENYAKRKTDKIPGP